MKELKTLNVDDSEALTRLFKALFTLFTTKDKYSWAAFKNTLLSKKGEEF